MYFRYVIYYYCILLLPAMLMLRMMEGGASGADNVELLCPSLFFQSPSFGAFSSILTTHALDLEGERWEWWEWLTGQEQKFQ